MYYLKYFENYSPKKQEQLIEFMLLDFFDKYDVSIKTNADGGGYIPGKSLYELYDGKVHIILWPDDFTTRIEAEKLYKQIYNELLEYKYKLEKIEDIETIKLDASVDDGMTDNGFAYWLDIQYYVK